MQNRRDFIKKTGMMAAVASLGASMYAVHERLFRPGRLMRYGLVKRISREELKEQFEGWSPERFLEEVRKYEPDADLINSNHPVFGQINRDSIRILWIVPSQITENSYYYPYIDISGLERVENNQKQYRRLVEAKVQWQRQITSERETKQLIINGNKTLQVWMSDV